MADPTDDYTIKAVRLAAGRPVMIRAAVPGELAAALDRLYGPDAAAVPRSAAPAPAAADDVKRLSDLASEEPVIRYVNRLVASAAAARASDIHIEADPDRVVLRLRVDGLLRDVEPPPAGLHDRIVSRIKITAGLNIAERRLPQDGRFRMAVEGREIDLRVSIVPTLHGESVVMRLFDRERAPLDLAELGFSAELRHALERLVTLPSGMLLVTGPDRQRQDLDALCRAAAPQHARAQDPDGRGPGRVPASRHQPDPGAPGDRPQLREPAARAVAPGPGRAAGGRDPRPRDRAHRGAGEPHRPPAALDRAHQRRGQHGRAAPRHGARGLSPRLGAEGRRGAASGALALPRLPRALRSAARPRRALGACGAGARGCRAVPRRRLRGVRLHRISRPHRDRRVFADRRAALPAHPRARRRAGLGARGARVRHGRSQDRRVAQGARRNDIAARKCCA